MEGRWKQNIVRVGSAAFCHVPEPSAAQAVYLSVDGRPVCYFLLSDQVRADASTAINALKHLGVTPVMLSGDSAQRCLPIARELDIEFMAGQTPESKLAQLRSEKASHAGPIMMVGDGINDVPTLAGADISATVVEATDLVKSKADVLLLTRKLIPLVELLHVSHKTVNIIRQNLAWALAYNITAIPLAAFGFMPPWLAALGMASSSTLVMLNAVRLVNQPASIRSGS